jgi:serine/tyrosine/threonine adenylyltransferase
MNNHANQPLTWLNRFHNLGSAFFTEMPPHAMRDPHWVARSAACADALGLHKDWWQPAELDPLQVFSGNAQWPGMQPLASVYSGHQFGHWAGQLGDGRALWLGEIETPQGPAELQLKGAGLTPYSRMGDGRAVLRSSIREFLCSEAMHALGIPTTRALCITGSALPVMRETLETASVVTRAAASFIRFGHFEHFGHHTRADAPTNLKQLADFVIAHHYPDCKSAPNPYAALLEEVAMRTAHMMAGWQSVGFCHGVMNTDNMSILGLTIDYGPFGFLDAFDPGHICNHTDQQGRYAFARQPNVAFWNLHALAQALMPLIGDSDAALAALEPYKTAFMGSFMAKMRAKLGLTTAQDGDQSLIDNLLKLMAQDRCDFTIMWRRLSSFDSTPGAFNAAARDMFMNREAFDAWALTYRQRLHDEASNDSLRAVAMNQVNPKYILRNHLADVAIQRAKTGDFSEVQKLHELLQHPFDEQTEHTAYADFPPDWAQHLEVSCSS